MFLTMFAFPTFMFGISLVLNAVALSYSAVMAIHLPQVAATAMPCLPCCLLCNVKIQSNWWQCSDPYHHRDLARHILTPHDSGHYLGPQLGWEEQRTLPCQPDSWVPHALELLPRSMLIHRRHYQTYTTKRACNEKYPHVQVSACEEVVP